jgi:hypothetical protein
VFDDVVKSPHPFALPRAIAQFYRGAITDEEFKGFWNLMYPDDDLYLLYFVKKALLEKRGAEAEKYLDELETSLLPGSWAMMLADNLRGVMRKMK